MHMITAIIRPSSYQAVREALTQLGIQGITSTQCQGFGRQRGQTEIYRGAEYEVLEVPKLRLDVAVSGADLSQAIEAINKAARTGKTGDGKIFVTSLKEVHRIRTGEVDEAALT